MLVRTVPENTSPLLTIFFSHLQDKHFLLLMRFKCFVRVGLFFFATLHVVFTVETKADTPATTPNSAKSVDYQGELPFVKPEEVGMSSAKLALVKSTMQQFVDEKKVSGAIVIAARGGKVVLFESVGFSDLETKKPMKKDSILRFYSMTKPITSVSIMMLVEEGKIELDDSVSKYIPEFSGLEVIANPSSDSQKTENTFREMTIHDLLRHTSGLTYGFFGNSHVDRAYSNARVLDRTDTLQDTIDKLSKIPLLYRPGTRFNYSVSTDVLGHVIERVSGQKLNDFFQKHIFEPLNMHDTGFHVPAEKVERFANNYGPKEDGNGLRVIDAAAMSRYLQRPSLLSGGGGLVSTARDYMRFCTMLLNKGELGGRRLLRAETIDQMTRNQLPEPAYPISLSSERREGVGFGLGFSVIVEKTNYTKRSKIGEYGWGGAASTHFWISPKDDLAVIVLSQRMPFTFQLEHAVKPMVYEAILK